MKKGKIIFLLSVILGSFLFPKEIYAQQNEIPLKVVTEEEEFVLDSMIFFNLTDLQEYIGDGNGENDNSKAGLFTPTWTYYIHSGTRERGLGNFLYEQYHTAIEVEEKNHLYIKADVFLNNKKFAEGFRFIQSIEKDEELLSAELGEMYVSICGNRGNQILFSIELITNGEKNEKCCR